MGLMAFLPVLALYVQERFAIDDPELVAWWASVIYGAGPLSAACMGPLWGAMGDRYGKKRMAVRANAAIALTTAFMPFAPSPTWLLVARVAQGTFAGYVAPAMALVTAQLPRSVHGRFIARLQVAMALGSCVGPYLGAEVTGWFGRSAVFWIASLFSGVSALRLWIGAVEDQATPAAQARTFLQSFWSGARELLSSRVFVALLVCVTVLRLGQNMLEPLLSLFVRELGPEPLLLRWSDTEQRAIDRTIAVAFGLLAIGQWLFTPWWGRLADRHGPLRCLAVLALGVAATQVGMSMTGSIDGFLVLRAGLACFMAGSLTLAYAAASKRVDDAHRTLSFSLVQSCIQLGLAFGPMLGTLAASGGEHPDFRRAFLLAAALCAVAGGAMLLLRRFERRLPT